MSRALGFFLLFGTVGWLVLSTGAAAVYLDVPVLLFCLLGTCGGVLATGGGVRCLKALRALLLGAGSRSDAQAAILLGRPAIRLSYAVGAIGALVLIVNFYIELDDPGNWLFFPPVKVFLSLGYSVVLSEFILRPRVNALRLHDRVARAESSEWDLCD